MKRRFEDGKVFPHTTPLAPHSISIDPSLFQVLSYLPSYKGAVLRTINAAEDANLYDINALVILPATKGRTCSMVEIMAVEAQCPDYFVSHWSVCIHM